MCCFSGPVLKNEGRVNVLRATQGFCPMRFAMAAEVIVEDLSYSDTVQVMQTEGDEGALIIWLDEEAVL